MFLNPLKSKRAILSIALSGSSMLISLAELLFHFPPTFRRRVDGKKWRGEKVSQEVEYQTERLDHLGIVARVCQEAGIAEWLDKQAGDSRRSVSRGKAAVAMILSGLGFSNRQLYLVPQYFENKPVEHLLGEGITADMQSARLFGAHVGLALRA
jgi:hypothetical protein